MSTPWHERSSKIEEERIFERLLSLHNLTDAWLHAMTPDEGKKHLLERMSKLTLNQNLWLLEKRRLDELPLELHQLVGSQSVTEFLKTFAGTLWTIQISQLENAFSETKDRPGLLSMLEQTSWNHGKRVCEKAWDLDPFKNLNDAFQAFLQSHFYHPKAFLLGRNSSQELSFIWYKSPLQDPALKDSTEIETLCKLHAEWIRGFFYGLSRSIQVKYKKCPLDDSAYYEFTLLLTY